MGDQFVEATERAIAKVVTDFQCYPDRFWNERDLHWSLFYYLKQEGVIQETYVTQLIRAEFPTVKKFGERNPARGHYDLVVLDPESYFSKAVQRMKAWDPWDKYLELVRVMIAVEVKLWLARLRLKGVKEDVDWDIKKLKEPPNNVLNAFSLNFVQLDFSQPHNEDYYRDIRECLMCYKGQYPDLKILFVPSETRTQPDPSNNWL